MKSRLAILGMLVTGHAVQHGRGRPRASRASRATTPRLPVRHADADADAGLHADPDGHGHARAENSGSAPDRRLR